MKLENAFVGLTIAMALAFRRVNGREAIQNIFSKNKTSKNKK